MNRFNWSKAVGTDRAAKCMGYVCVAAEEGGGLYWRRGPVLFEKQFFKKNKEKAVRKIIIEKPLVAESGKEYVLPLTTTLRCCFLTLDNLCAIYERRPEICRLQGTIQELPCASKNQKQLERNVQ